MRPFNQRSFLGYKSGACDIIQSLIQFQSYKGFKIKPYKRRRRVAFILQRTCIILVELERIKLNELYETRTWNKALLHKHETKEIAWSYYKLEASLITSSYAPELTNTRLSRPSLILKKPEFNFKYLRFAY